MTEERSFPKCTKAEMLPNFFLRCEFDNKEIRYFPMHDSIEKIMTPLDLETYQTHYLQTLFLGDVAAWIGNEISIEGNGDVKVNGKFIPTEALWKYSLKHYYQEDKNFEEELLKIKHPILQGFLHPGVIAGMIFLVILIILLIASHS